MPAVMSARVRAAQRLAEAELAADYDEDARAVSLHAEARALAADCDDAVLDVHVLITSARLALRFGDYATSFSEADQALDVAMGVGDEELIAAARVAYSRGAARLGARERALYELEQSWKVLEHGSDPRAAYWCMHQIGYVLGDIGLVEDAQLWTQRALDHARTSGLTSLILHAKINLAACWIELGDALMARGDEGAARRAWESGVAHNEELLTVTGDGMDTSARNRLYLKLNRSECLERLGRDEEALPGFLAIQREDEGELEPETRFALHCQVARVLMRQGDLDAAREEVEHAIAAAEGIGLRISLVQLYELGSQVAELQGDVVEALDRYKMFHAMYQDVVAEAKRQGQVLAARMGTELVRSDMLAHRAQSRELAQLNRSLTDKADELEHAAGVDPLTGLANRRRLDDELRAAHRSAAMSGAPLWVAMLDLDHFKQVNDRFSHAVGDAVLQRVASVMREVSRSGDLAVRYGGEEFLLVIGSTERTDAVAVCERLRAGLERHSWGEVADGLAVTASIGVADIAAFSDLATGLLRVDSLLYEAKAGGRNRVFAA